MPLSLTPDLSRSRRIALGAAIVSAAEAALMLALNWTRVGRTLGDPDNAMRLVLVRDLLAGRGWFDQLVTRLDPRHGVYLHWSRLLDGALAAAIWLVERVTSPANAELYVRAAWPLLCLFPAVMAAITIAKNLGARSAVLIAAVAMALELPLYRQFWPGRIDHHDTQITLALVSLAIATARTLTPRAAAAAGVATGLGLAIGVEALPIYSLVGASLALRFALDRATSRPVAAYGLSLALASTSFFLAQTPPSRLGLSFCDALGLNLVSALIVTGLGLAAIAFGGGRLSPRWRGGLVCLLATVEVATYLSLDPACIAGPFAGIDPRLRAVWMSHVQEMKPLWIAIAERPQQTIGEIVAMSMGLAAALYVWWRNPRGVPQILGLATLALACAMATEAGRMNDYALWIGVPMLAAGLSYFAQARLGDRLVPTLALASLLAPILVGAFVSRAFGFDRNVSRETVSNPSRCEDTASFAHLAQLPPGIVLADVDLGPYILANTPHSILSAPYHRMPEAILAAHDALDAPPDRAEAAVRRLGATYVVDCPDRTAKPLALISSLRTNGARAWLTRVSTSEEALQIWRARAQ